MVSAAHQRTVTQEEPAEQLIRSSLIVPRRPPLSERMGATAGNVLNTASEDIFIVRPVDPAKEQRIALRIRLKQEEAGKRQAALLWEEEEQERIALQQVLAAQEAIQQQVNIGDIIAEICTLPLSQESQDQLEQWIKDFLSTENSQLQLSLSAILVFNFLRPLVDEFPDELTLADVETKLFLWIAQRLPQGQNIDDFMRKCRKGLKNKAAHDIALANLDAYGRELLRTRTQGAKQLVQASSHQVVNAVSSLQQQRRSRQTTATAVEALRGRLQEEENKLRVHTHNAENHGEQINSTKARLTEQLNRLKHEAARL